MKALQAVSLFLLVLLGSLPQARAERVALIIANSNYKHISNLANPRNDAVAISGLLQKIGFASAAITVKYDLDYNDMRLAIRDFKRRTAGAEAALIYFAGHGLGGEENVLVPVDAELKSWAEIRDETISQRALEDAVSLASGIKLVILDACRNDPSRGNMTGVPKTRSIDRGLSRVEPDGGILVAYSAKHGTVAQDGAPGGNSPFARALVKHLATPGEDIRLVFGGVRDEVMRATNNQQEPFLYGSLGQKRLILAGASDQQSPSPVVTPPLNDAGQIWGVIQNTVSQAVLEDFIRRYGDSVFGGFARTRLKELHEQEQRELQTRLEPQRAAKEQPAPAETYYVTQDVSFDLLNMRTGPGTQYPIVTAIPKGATGLQVGRCQTPQDASSRFPWCQVNWQGQSGWVSSCCILGSRTGQRPQ